MNRTNYYHFVNSSPDNPFSGLTRGRAAYYKLLPNGDFEIRFGQGIKPTLCFSAMSLQQEITVLEQESNIKVFSEIEFVIHKLNGIIVEVNEGGKAWMA